MYFFIFSVIIVVIKGVMCLEFIGLVIISIWVISKLFGGTNNKGGLNEIEKYKTFESLRKK